MHLGVGHLGVSPPLHVRDEPLLGVGEIVGHIVHPRRRAPGVQAEHLVRMRDGHLLRYAGAQVGPTHAVALVSEHIRHQPVEQLPDVTHTHARPGGPTTEPEPRQGRDHQVEPIGEHRHDGQHLQERARPPVQHQHGHDRM